MSLYEIENPYISTDLQFFVNPIILILVHKIKSSCAQIFFKVVFFKVLQNSQENVSVSFLY